MFVGLLALALAPGAAAQSALFPSPHTAICYLDVNGDGLRSADDPVYLQQACAAGTSAGDARLFASGGLPGGTLIHGLDADAGTPTAPLAASYASYDADGSGAYNPGDPLFLAFGPMPGPLRPGDVPLTGSSPFTSVPPSDPRVGWPLTATSVPVGGESYQERDGTQGFTTRDAVYLDLDGSAQISLGDLRLAVPAESPPSTSPSTSAAPSPTAAATTTPPAPTPEAPAPPRGSPASGDGLSGTRPRETPGPGLATVAILLLGSMRRPSH